MVAAIPARRAGGHRPRPIRLAAGYCRGGVRRSWTLARIHQHGRDVELCPARRAQPSVCGLAAEKVRSGTGRSYRFDDAQYPAVPDRAVRRAACRHGGRQHQPPLHGPRTRASAEGLRCESRSHRRELHACAAASSAADGSEEGARHACRRFAGNPARLHREFRAEVRTEADSGMEDAGHDDVQERLGQRSRAQARAGAAGRGGHSLSAIHRRHYRRLQGRGSHPPQHGRECAAC